MTIRSDYRHGFAHGITIKEVPVIMSQGGNGNVFWVDSVHGSDGNTGTSKRPFATLAYAISRCTANNSDMIFLAEGHSESVIAAGTITLNIAGVSIFFCGTGTSKATINFTTATAASFLVTAANVSIVNPRFVSGIDALATPIVVTGANCKIYNAEWYDAPAKAATRGLVLSTGADGSMVDGWKFYGSTTGTQKQSQIKFVGLSNIELRNINIVGDFATANIENTAAATNSVLSDIFCNNLNVSPLPGIVQHANTTGIWNEVDIRIASGTTYISSVAKVNYANDCLGYNSDGKQGQPLGTAVANSLEGLLDTINTNVDTANTNIGDPSTDTLISLTAKLGNGATTVTADLGTLKTNVGDPSGHTLKSITAKLGNGATTVAADLGTLKTNTGDASGDTLKSVVAKLGDSATTVAADLATIKADTVVGSFFWVKKTLVSSAIVQAGVDVTGVSSTGALAVDQVILMTNGTGLATGTNVQLKTDNAMGAAIWAEEAVASLGASTTVSVPSVVNKKVILETGKKITINSTVADCDGAGTVDVYIKFQRLTAGATIAAA